MNIGLNGKTERFARGFSLVELLVVISIIGLLAGLSSVAVSKAMESGRKAKAKGELQAIISAVKAYKQEYGQWPTVEGIDADSSTEFTAWYGPSKYSRNGEKRGPLLIRILSGENISGGDWPREMNPKNVRFLEGAQSDGTFLDPWGTQYCVKMDVNESGGIEYGSSNGGEENLRLSVIAVSLGKNKTQEDKPSDPGFDDIYSWGQNLTQ